MDLTLFENDSIIATGLRFQLTAKSSSSGQEAARLPEHVRILEISSNCLRVTFSNFSGRLCLSRLPTNNNNNHHDDDDAATAAIHTILTNTAASSPSLLETSTGEKTPVNEEQQQPHDVPKARPKVHASSSIASSSSPPAATKTPRGFLERVVEGSENSCTEASASLLEQGGWDDKDDDDHHHQPYRVTEAAREKQASRILEEEEEDDDLSDSDSSNFSFAHDDDDTEVNSFKEESDDGVSSPKANQTSQTARQSVSIPMKNESDGIVALNAKETCSPVGTSPPVRAARSSRTFQERFLSLGGPTARQDSGSHHSVSSSNDDGYSRSNKNNKNTLLSLSLHGTAGEAKQAPPARASSWNAPITAMAKSIRQSGMDLFKEQGDSNRNSLNNNNSGHRSLRRRSGFDFRVGGLSKSSFRKSGAKNNSSITSSRGLSRQGGGRNILIGSLRRGTKVPADYLPPTRLHRLCAESDVVLSQLVDELESNPQSASIKDSLGRFPLHVLGLNDDLLSSMIGQATASEFALTLMQAYPDAITTKDDDGFMPFVELIKIWHDWVYDQNAKSKDSARPAFMGADRIREVFVDMDFSSVNNASRSNDNMGRGASDNRVSNVSETSARSFPTVDLWNEVEWCFDMLSEAMDEFGGKSGGLHTKHSRRTLINVYGNSDQSRTDLATHVATTMPTIMKTILLIENRGEGIRTKLLNSSLVRRLILCPVIIGPWVTIMLRKRGIPSTRAIDFLVLVSQTNVEDYVGSYRSILDNDRVAFQMQRDLVFAAMDELEGTVASLVVLPEREIERAAASSVVWYIMNDNLARPFVVSLVLVDFAMHVTLLFVSTACQADVLYCSILSFISRCSRHFGAMCPFTLLRFGIRIKFQRVWFILFAFTI